MIDTDPQLRGPNDINLRAASERPTPLPDIQRVAVELFGRTEDSFEARFVLSDGSFLLMPGGKHNKDHYKINRVFPTRLTPGEAILQFMNSGAIRFARWPDGGVTQEFTLAEFTRIPNDRQLTVLVRNSAGLKKVALDLMDSANGHRILSEALDFPRAFNVHAFISKAKEHLEQGM